jgi:cytochrome oxidase Cu insertion factor (SCO1/SenC/PrrC family)
MLLIATVFLGPLVVAAWMYYSGAFLPVGRTNHGALLEPIVKVTAELPTSELASLGDGYWVLVYANDGECTEACKNALYTLRQSRKMLGKEMDRLKRVFLHGVSTPDTVFLADEHAGLISLRDDSLMTLLNNKKPEALSAGGYFLMDPLGNLVMYFEPGTDPSNMVSDLKRLLKLSRIG